jgi:NAD(P)-dependent dehydrogenase (short-subunit alcohol dehydrogenase family)
VVLACRNPDKADDAVARIGATAPSGSTEILAMDLADLESVDRAAEQFLAGHDRLDLLVNNAGLMATPRQRTAQGFEMQLGVNHLGHWTLTALVMPALLRAPAARVVSVTSTAHHFGRPLDPDNPHLRGRYDPWRAYGQSKLANYHFGLGLQQRFERAGVAAQSLVAHPGLSHSDLQTTSVAEGGAGPLGPFFAWLAAHTGMDVDRGALPQIRAATDPRARGGEFYGPRFGNNGPAVRLPVLRRGNDAAIRTLWEVSERETGVALEVGAA